MQCFNCGNCKTSESTYFCLKENGFVLNKETLSKAVEKSRSGWKKGDPLYESHRRSTRKEVEV